MVGDNNLSAGDDTGALASDAEVDMNAPWPGRERRLIGLEQLPVLLMVNAAVVAARFVIVKGSTMTKKALTARADISLLLLVY